MRIELTASADDNYAGCHGCVDDVGVSLSEGTIKSGGMEDGERKGKEKEFVKGWKRKAGAQGT